MVHQRITRLVIALLSALALASAIGTAASSATTYSSTVFSDGFESGNLSAWDGAAGTGTVSVTAAAAHSGSYGAQITNASGQYSLIVKSISQPLVDSATKFWVNVAPGGGVQTLAEGRNAGSSQTLWTLLYDGNNHGLWFFPVNSAGQGAQIWTGNGSMLTGQWVQIEVDYTETSTGGAQVLINGQTQAAWGVTGNFTQSTGYQKLQLWDDTTGTTYFDDVSVAVPAGSAPGAPTGVTGSAGSGSVALSWTAPSSNGGSSITGYQVTPYLNGTAQTARLTGSTSTTYTVSGLTNGTAYTFAVAAINKAGAGANSAQSAAITPTPGTPPGAPTGVTGTSGNDSVALSWTAPSSSGSSSITGYQVTPYVSGTAQTALLTGSTSTSFTVTGLTNGTAYTFAVAAINIAGTGPNSAQSAAITPAAPVNKYNTTVFSDGFETGNLSAWDGAAGTGSVGVTGAAAHTGSYGAQITNTSGQYALITKTMSQPLLDSATSFWVKIAPGGGVQTLAEARDSTTSHTLWGLLYDGTNQGLWFYPVNSSGQSAQIYTGNASMPTGQWVQVEVDYTATSPGAAQVLINGQTQAAWGVTGNFQGSTEYQKLQLWDDTTATTDFDDVKVAVPPPTAPSAPTGVTAVARNQAAALSWTPPGSNGGSAVTGYQVTPIVNGTAGTPILTNSTSTSDTVTGLTNGTSYTFEVAAINAVGTGANSQPSTAVTPAPPVAPGAPTGVTGLTDDGAVSLSWTAPASDGGAAITGYTVTAYAGGTVQSTLVTKSSATSAYVTGLTDGTAYTFAVAATNSAGTGPNSAQSAPMTPLVATTVYTDTYFTDGFETGDLSDWNGAAGTGAASVNAAGAHSGSYGLQMTNTGAEYELTTKQFADPLEESSTRFWVNVGSGGGVETLAEARNAASQPVWALLYDPNAGGLYLFPYNSSGKSVQIYTGGGVMPTNSWAKIEVQYNAVASGGAQLYVDGQTQPSWGVTGNYSNSQFYQKLQLWNDQPNTTSFDDVKVAVEPSDTDTVPTAPYSVSGVARDSAVNLSWSAPQDDGGSPVTSYLITPYSGSTALTSINTGSSATSQTVTGLTNGTAYTFTVAAINGVGTSPASSASSAVTPVPAAVPGAPTALAGNPAQNGALLTWTAPASDGGAPITSYTITPYVNGTAKTAVVTNSSTTTYTVTGLTNGTAYTFTVAATNKAGTGAASAQSAAITPVTPSPPTAPTAVSGEPNDQAIALTWTAPSSNGNSPITSYTVTPYVNGTAKAPIVTNSSATSYTVTGLTDGTAYTFTVAATNAVGTGPASAQSAAITPSPPTAPATPTAVFGQNAEGGASLTWTAPSSDGGRAITSYTITPYVNGTAKTPVQTGSGNTTYTVTGLTDGTSYTFTVAATNSIGTGSASVTSLPVVPGPLNPIQVEEQQPGDTSWENAIAPPSPNYISGYGSQISINHGQSIDFYVTTTAASVSINIYRMGYYGGAGARLMDQMGSFPGVNQPQATPSTTNGMVTENWTKTATLNVPSTWTTGVYMAMLSASNGYGGYIMFVVRDDGGHEPILFQLSTNTYQAYNDYGGTSLYNNDNPTTGPWPYPHALKVSFDRPFLDGNGAGQFLWWEFPFVRWLEENGYNVAYTTDTDTSLNQTNPITNHKAFLSVGHDEYWSNGMRQAVQAAIAAGVNVGFFAGNESYWQVRYEPNAAGVANRVMDGYKDFSECTCDGGPDPDYGVNNALVTTEWRDPVVNEPEDAMMGVMFGGETNNSPYDVTDASSWVFTGTGFTNSTSIPGIVGYEYDHYFGDSTTPAGTTVLSNTPLTNTETNTPDTANSTIYKAPSGAHVFAAGTIQWSYGLDNFGLTPYVNPGIQRTTANIIDAFTGLWTPSGGGW